MACDHRVSCGLGASTAIHAGMKRKRSRVRVALTYFVEVLLLGFVVGLVLAAVTDLTPEQAGRVGGSLGTTGGAIAALIGLIRGDRSQS